MRQARFPHFPIVAQVTPNLNRWLGSVALRRMAFALVLAFAGVVTAFGIAPDTVTETVTRSRVIERVTLPAVTMAAEPAMQTYWREVNVQRGDTLARVLARLGVNTAGVVDELSKMPEAKPLFSLAPGHALRVVTSATGELVMLKYLNGEQMITVEPDGDVFKVSTMEAALEKRVVTATGEISSSFFAAIDTAKIPDAISAKLVEIFSTEVDFYRGLRRGDRFTVIYEAFYDDGEPVTTGRLLAAEFLTRGKTYNMVWFDSKPGKGGGAYFTFDGRDTRKSAFLQSPLEVSRISSGFTEERYHPILQSWQAHKGVDYAAPIGTKILAVADGVVEFVGMQPGYGNVVILQHQNKHSTLYAHMSEFENGLVKGARVNQGETIGLVGMTGLTTGPHLHFEFLIDGVHHDPLSVDMPKGLPLAADVKQAIKTAAAPYARTIGLLRESKLTRFE